MRRAATGLCLAAALASPVLAADDPALYPAAQCAAFWFGWHDYAAQSAYLPAEPKDLMRADAFRQVALHLTSQGEKAVDAFIADERQIMAVMVEAYIFGDDRQSRDVTERLMQDCADFAKTQPETMGLR